MTATRVGSPASRGPGGRPRPAEGGAPRRRGATASLRLTLDTGLQETAEGALAERGSPGDRRDTLAAASIGSYPTHDPAFYVRPHTAAEHAASSGARRSAAEPAIRADIRQGRRSSRSPRRRRWRRAIEPDTIFNDTGSFDVGGLVLHNAGAARGDRHERCPPGLVDVYFIASGRGAASGRHGQIQDWAQRHGLGQRPGIDISGASGPDSDSGMAEPRLPEGSNPYIDRPTQGDNVNLAIGQGDVQVTPLQLARAYAALANGGRLVTPHIGGRVIGRTARRSRGSSRSRSGACGSRRAPGARSSRD